MRAEMSRASAWFVIAAATALALIACGDDISAPVEGTVFVSIKDNAFQPETVTVSLGGSVRWTNQGATLHSVVEDTGLWHSELLSPTWWFDVRFDDPGTFPYHCTLHQETGSVIVQ